MAWPVLRGGGRDDRGMTSYYKIYTTDSLRLQINHDGWSIYEYPINNNVNSEFYKCPS